MFVCANIRNMGLINKEHSLRFYQRKYKFPLHLSRGRNLVGTMHYLDIVHFCSCLSSVYPCCFLTTINSHLRYLGIYICDKHWMFKLLNPQKMNLLFFFFSFFFFFLVLGDGDASEREDRSVS